MEPVLIHTSFEETYRQLLFIDKFIVSAANKKNRRRTLFFLVLTVASAFLFFFTDSDAGVVGIFMLPILWVCFGLYLIYFQWKTYKRQNITLKQLADATSLEYTTGIKLSFTREEVSLIQADTTSSVRWHEFNAYLEEDNTIYLFQENPYLAWSFSDKEIGPSAVAALKEIAKQKLPLSWF